MLNYKLLTVLAFILTSGIFYEDAFATADFSPVQPNAYVSYNTADNEVQVSWDFTTGSNDAPVTCLLKGDFVWHEDLDNKHTSGVPDVDYDKVYGFIPSYYSVVSSSPTVVNTAKTTEVIPCQGNTRIDLNIVMNHSKNINNYKDLEIFLSFYALAANTSVTLETFNFQSNTYLDQIFVLYTPTVTWSDGAKNYACNGEPGNVLYIDQSGIHGNNGDNCNKYETILDDQWVDIGGANNAAALNDGEIDNGFHNEPYFSYLYQVVEEEIITKKGGSDDDHNSRPTFGIDHKRFTQLVDEGLVVNGQIIPVLNNFHTQMDIIELAVGDTQNFTSTVFAPHTLKILEFVFGVPELGEWNEREASIEIETNYDGEALDFEINDDDDSPIINATSLVYSASKVKCNANDNTDACYRVSIEFSFLEAPIGKVLALQAIDNSRKNEITYFNDGLDITGDSLNPSTVQQISSEIKYKGLQTIQRIDKENNIWMTLDKSEPVLTYQQNSHGTFIALEYRTFEQTPDKIQMNMQRVNSNFKDIITYEQNRATLTFDSQLIQGEDPTSWSYVYPPQVDRIAELEEIMKEQEMIAIEILEAK